MWYSAGMSSELPSTTTNGSSRNSMTSTSTALATPWRFQSCSAAMPNLSGLAADEGGTHCDIDEEHQRHEHGGKGRAFPIVGILDDHLLDQYRDSAHAPAAEQHRGSEGTHAHVERDQPGRHQAGLRIRQNH